MLYSFKYACVCVYGMNVEKKKKYTLNHLQMERQIQQKYHTNIISIISIILNLK